MATTTANSSPAQAKKKPELWSQQAKDVRERADAVVDQALPSVEVGAAGLPGLADGYAGKTLAVGGVPVDLLGALALRGVDDCSDRKST